MLAAGITSFYTMSGGRECYYSVSEKKYLPVGYPDDMIAIPALKAAGKTVAQYAEAALTDMGDGVLAFEIQSRNAALSIGLYDALEQAYEELRKNWRGMVITSAGKSFCVGADLKGALSLIEAGDFSGIEAQVAQLQSIVLRHKYSPKPIVAAPFAMTLGGGCELAIQCAGIQAAGETYMGLVEFGVGLVPAGGGMKELTLRALERIEGTLASPTDFLLAAVQLVALAKTSSSGYEAIEMGLLRKGDGVSLSREYQMTDAKQKVLSLLAGCYRPPVVKSAVCPGANDNGLLLASAKAMLDAGAISEYDYYILERLAYIMTGGGVSKGTLITERYLMDLEREVFVGLCREKRTRERIAHMISTGKPLRN
jgi:3-hydroxyacyl-CoA dehydrogenase